MFLKMLLVMLSLVHGVSFAMIVRYKDKEAQKRVENSVSQYLVKKEISAERKRWQSLPQEEQGLYKLARLYEKQDNPKFVERYLKNQDVPIFLASPGDDEEVYGIDPYAKSFYKNSDKQIFAVDQEIVEIGRLKAENIKKLYSCLYKGALDSLASAIFFGKDEDITHEFMKIDESWQGNNLSRHLINLGNIALAIKYSFVKNNALELLLQREKQLSVPLMDKQSRCDIGYALLKMAAQNKKTFELIAHTDPYNSNRKLYSYFFGTITHLHRMKEMDDTFDQEHIEIFVREGGMNVQEVEGMKQVGRILKGKMTLEELAVENTWKKIIEDINGENSNKFLEAQMLLRDAQEREEAERRFRLAIVAQILMGGNVHQDTENAIRRLEQALRYAQGR